MGLTVHYSLKARGGEDRARELVRSLHQAAQDLPFQELGPVIELSGEQCNYERLSNDDPSRWLLIQARGSVTYPPAALHRSGAPTTWFNVLPLRVIAFTAWPGEGCEESNFGLCQYPPVIETPYGSLRTNRPGWSWSSFCKTQYASNPEHGGVVNFLRCHLTVIAMLDRAKQLGCLEKVSDEGEFWKKRDLAALSREIGSWNEMLAAFGGKLKDLVGEGHCGVQSAITEYPNFEQLEAAGQNKLPPGVEKLFGLIERVGAFALGTAKEP